MLRWSLLKGMRFLYKYFIRISKSPSLCPGESLPCVKMSKIGQNLSSRSFQLKLLSNIEICSGVVRCLTHPFHLLADARVVSRDSNRTLRIWFWWCCRLSLGGMCDGQVQTRGRALLPQSPCARRNCTMFSDLSEFVSSCEPSFIQSFTLGPKLKFSNKRTPWHLKPYTPN